MEDRADSYVMLSWIGGWRAMAERDGDLCMYVVICCWVERGRSLRRGARDMCSSSVQMWPRKGAACLQQDVRDASKTHFGGGRRREAHISG